LINGEFYQHNYETYSIPEIEGIVKAKSLDIETIKVMTSDDSKILKQG
jgi:hypothetical protein